MTACPHGDVTCPCQDGDPCHYEPTDLAPGTLPMASPMCHAQHVQLHAHPGVRAQPVSNVQWLPREQLHANDYNPNVVAPPERKLLRLSILEDGWTQPIVRRPDGEIVDGFHRWETSNDPAVWALTDGLVPTVVLRPADPAHQRMSTIRHNRARGTHHVVKMADIVATLVASGLPPTEVALRLGMEQEEVRRLLDRGRMTERGASPDGMGEAWRPIAKT